MSEKGGKGSGELHHSGVTWQDAIIVQWCQEQILEMGLRGDITPEETLDRFIYSGTMDFVRETREAPPHNPQSAIFMERSRYSKGSGE